MIVILIGVSLIVFTIMMLIPEGQRVSVYVKSEKIRPEQIEALIIKYGLRDPAPVQYFRWMKNIVQGEFGHSVTAAAPVVDGFKRYFPVTLQLVLYSTP